MADLVTPPPTIEVNRSALRVVLVNGGEVGNWGNGSLVGFAGPVVAIME